LAPEVFDGLCNYLKKHYIVSSFNEIPTLKNPQKPIVVLSFDDGYYDFVENGLDILRKHQLPSNHNIVFDCANENKVIWTQRMNHIFTFLKDQNLENLVLQIDGTSYQLKAFGGNWKKMHLDFFYRMMTLTGQQREGILTDLENRLHTQSEERMMDWNDLKECASNNVEIGNHTYSHAVMSTISDENELYQETIVAGREIGKKLGTEVNIFCYPNGKVNERSYQLFSNHGYKFILEMNEKLNSINQFYNTKPIIINRINIPNESLDRIILRTELFQNRLKKFL